jgi:hypothetical protein
VEVLPSVYRVPGRSWIGAFERDGRLSSTACLRIRTSSEDRIRLKTDLGLSSVCRKDQGTYLCEMWTAGDQFAGAEPTVKESGDMGFKVLKVCGLRLKSKKELRSYFCRMHILFFEA